MTPRLALVCLLPVLQACSLDYLDENLDGSAGTSGSGAGPCGCTPPGENVLYDENFDRDGWCNDNLATNDDTTSPGLMDPDAREGDDACQSLRMACVDTAAGCFVHTRDTFPETTGPIFIRLRIKFPRPWTNGAFVELALLDVGNHPVTEVSFGFRLIARDNGGQTGFFVRPCGSIGCSIGETVPDSDVDWHTLVVHDPNDGGELEYRWDGTNVQSAGQGTAGFGYTHINLGWARVDPVDGPDILVDDVRICSAEGAKECGWE